MQRGEMDEDAVVTLLMAGEMMRGAESERFL